MKGHPGFAGRSIPDSAKATSPNWDLLSLSTELLSECPDSQTPGEPESPIPLPF